MVRVKGRQAPKTVFPPVPITMFGVVRQSDVFLKTLEGPRAMLNLVSHVLSFPRATKMWGPPKVHESSVSWTPKNS